MRQKLLSLKHLLANSALAALSVALTGCAQPGTAGYTTVLSQLPAASPTLPLSDQQRRFYDALGAQMLAEQNWAAAVEHATRSYSYPPLAYNIYSWPYSYWPYPSYPYWRSYSSRYGWR